MTGEMALTPGVVVAAMAITQETIMVSSRAESHRNVRVYQYSNADNYGGGGGGGYDRRDNYGGGGGGYGRDNYGEDVRCSHVKEKSLLMSRHLV